MKPKASDVLFSAAVRAVQAEMGSRDYIGRLASRGAWGAELSEDQAAFIRTSDSFYFGTASKEGRPYIQHRGGPRGFLRVEGPSALWFPDYCGNRQYISVGNLSENDQAFVFLMDYTNRRRLKLWGRARVADRDAPPPGPIPEDSPAVERIIRFQIEALDENCRRHITPRGQTGACREQLVRAQQEIAALKERIRLLEAASDRGT